MRIAQDHLLQEPHTRDIEAIEDMRVHINGTHGTVDFRYPAQFSTSRQRHKRQPRKTPKYVAPGLHDEDFLHCEVIRKRLGARKPTGSFAWSPSMSFPEQTSLLQAI